jgi:hypothetical protein
MSRVPRSGQRPEPTVPAAQVPVFTLTAFAFGLLAGVLAARAVLP